MKKFFSIICLPLLAAHVTAQAKDDPIETGKRENPIPSFVLHSSNEETIFEKLKKEAEELRQKTELFGKECSEKMAPYLEKLHAHWEDHYNKWVPAERRTTRSRSVSTEQQLDEALVQQEQPQTEVTAAQEPAAAEPCMTRQQKVLLVGAVAVGGVVAFIVNQK